MRSLSRKTAFGGSVPSPIAQRKQKTKSISSGCGTVWYVRSLVSLWRQLGGSVPSPIAQGEQSSKRKTTKQILNRGVAQFGSALGSGPRGRRFESCHSDQSKKTSKDQSFFNKIGADFLEKFIFCFFKAKTCNLLKQMTRYLLRRASV